LEYHLDQIGVTATRFPALDSRFCRDPRGYENKGRYALALTIRLAIRKAKQLKSPSLLLLADDAILHPNFHELISRIELPDDWGIFYLGCQHTSRPKPLAEGLVKVTRALDSHAWAIQESAYDKDITWTHWLKDAGSPVSHPVISSEHLIEILNSDAFFARKFPKDADIGNYGLNLK